ncbi:MULTISPECIES: hypothetical protein [Emticicia]|uniref:hypothetical protein n=1 Tax=Emticicia TaxID=312278 RepID=UPI0020A00771|nr:MULTISPECIES: hypothetical protein [Emticicia]UTA66987.1 hypothetical protein MB380_15430 [Emticicia sp. 21SJ11W-3]
MQRVITVLLAILVIFNIYVFLNDSRTALLIGATMLMPLLGVYYGFARKWAFASIDKLMYFACFIGAFSDLSIYLNYHGNGELIQISLACIVHLVYIIIFQKEGTRVYNLQWKNSLKLAFPASFVFFFFGFVLLKVIPDTVFLVTVLYAFELFVLLVLGYFRPVNKKSYWVGVTGVTIILVKDILYSEFYFINQDKTIHALMDVTNALAYYSITLAVALNQNDKTTTPNYPGFISKFIKFISRSHMARMVSLKFINLRYQISLLYRSNRH